MLCGRSRTGGLTGRAWANTLAVVESREVPRANKERRSRVGRIDLGSCGGARRDGLCSWLSQDTATGDWGGLRSRAEAAGVTFEGNYQTDLLTNPIGGEKQGFRL